LTTLYAVQRQRLYHCPEAALLLLLLLLLFLFSFVFLTIAVLLMSLGDSAACV